MKAFIIKVFGFIIPLFTLIISVELMLQNSPTYFQKRAEYFFNNQDKIEVLILGSSHNQNAINQEYITFNTSNLAYFGQDLTLDYTLLSKYISTLPKLKAVIIELSYHSLNQITPSWSPQNPLYLRYYGINNYQRANRLMDYSIFMIDPPLFTKMLLLNKNSSTINKYGFETDLKNLDQRVLRFKNMNYDTSVINNDTSNGFIKRHSKEYAKTYNKNKIIFLKLIALCVQNGVTPVVLAPPVYMNYYKAMNPQKKKKRDDLLSFIKTKNPQTLVYNFEHTESFTVKDFMNEDHLSPQGAKKFTLLIDSILKRNLNKN